MSTALLPVFTEFNAVEHSRTTFRNSNTQSVASTSDKPASSAPKPSTIHSTTSSHSSAKMSGGIRRTVSSANSSSGISNSRAAPGTKPLNSNNTQASQSRTGSNGHHNTSHKEPHKKLDRSFSEPAEKKNSNSSVSSASLGPSSRYKTELCRSFAEVGSCKYGDKCQFAHGDDELRTITRHPKFKTENCKSFHSTGFCPYGPRCHFIHNNDESKKSVMSHMQNSPASLSQRIFDHSAPLPVTGSLLTNQVSSGHQGSTGANLPSLVSPYHTTSPTSVLNTANLVRPKALSLGSYSLGSSGETSSPSSQSGSPTSLNSFFTEDGSFGLGGPFSGSNSRISTAVSNFQSNNSFSFSPNSAFVSFNPSSGPSGPFPTFGNTTNSSIFGGSQPTLSSSFSPEPTSADETANSVISSLFGASPSSTPFSEPMSELMFRAMSPIGANRMLYPTSPESPVDSVASEIEALKLGEQATSFSPISSSFSTSSMSTSSASPPNGHVDLDTFTLLSNPAAVSNCVNIPRLPTFAKFATTTFNMAGTGSKGIELVE